MIDMCNVLMKDETYKLQQSQHPINMIPNEKRISMHNMLFEM